jgi:hypothetical protein
MELIAVILLVLLVLFGEVGLYRRRGLEGLSYRCHFSETERTEGESLQFVETVTNDKTLPVPWLKAELTTSRWLDFPEANSAVTGENRFVSSFFSAAVPVSAASGRSPAKNAGYMKWNISCW